ncbi:MAG: hypothetical protein ACRD3C_10385 [Vicinamibacterales bacterium]
MPMRPRRFAAGCTSALFLLTTGLWAQDRFRVLEQHVIAEVSGLRIVTVRDTQLSQCYTLFIMDPPAALNAIPPPPPVDDVTDEAIQRIRDAAEQRDRQLADLKAQIDRSGWWDAFAVGRYETARRKVEEEYEQTLQAEIPGSYSWATPFPGMRNGGWEDETISVTEQSARIDVALERLSEARRVAASGPVRCTGDIEVKKPRR